MADYTTTGLLANMKRRGFTPSSSGLTTSDLLSCLSETLRTYIPAFLKGLREEFIISQLSIAVTSATVPVPARACGIALRTIGWLESDGRVRPLTRIEPERRSDWGQSGSSPRGFMFQGNNCILVPAVTSGTLVVSYQQRTGELVLPTSAAVIDNRLNSTTLVVSNAPNTIASDVLCDVVGFQPNFKLKAMDLEVVAVSDNGGGFSSVVFTDTLPTTFVAGDFLCLANETCVPAELPLECFDLLAQATAFQIASDTGSERLKTITLALERLEKQVALVLSPRDDGGARVIVNRSRIGRWGC